MTNMNLKLSILLLSSDDEDLSGFEDGKIKVEGNLGNYFSNDSAKSFMIVPAVELLLDGIKSFVIDKSVGVFRWETMKGENLLNFVRKSGGKIEISSKKLKIALIDERTLISSIDDSISEFLDNVILHLSPNSVVVDDFNSSLKNFRTLIK